MATRSSSCWVALTSILFICLCQNWMRGRGYRNVHVWGHIHEAAMDSGIPEDRLGRQKCHRFCVIDYVLLTRGRHCLGGAPGKILRSTDRQRARGLELSEEQRGRARTRSADSCAMASISRTNYHAALARRLVATARIRSLKIWGSGLGQPNDYRPRRYWKQTLKAALLAPGDPF